MLERERAQSARTRAEQDTEIAELKVRIATFKAVNADVALDDDYSEEETRDLFIDAMLLTTIRSAT